ncbi:MAG: outer membrane beta-barrel protein [Acidobacteriota bacterium]
MRLTALFALIAVTCSAQVFEVGGQGGVSRLSSRTIGSVPGANAGDPRSEVQLKDGWRFSLRATLNTGRFTGYEFGYAYNRTHLLVNGEDNGGMAIHQGLFNYMLYALPEGKRVRPFATGGANFSNFIPPGASVTSGGGDNKFGFNYGGGVKVILTDTLLLRLDARQYQTPKPFDLVGASGWLKQLEISVGISFYLH